MKLRIVLDPRSVKDLSGHYHYLNANSTKAAQNFINASQRTFDHLTEMPQLGSPGKFNHPLLKEVRQWRVQGFESYLIFYRFSEETIEILRVLHGARDIESLLQSDFEDEL